MDVIFEKTSTQGFLWLVSVTYVYDEVYPSCKGLLVRFALSKEIGGLFHLNSWVVYRLYVSYQREERSGKRSILTVPRKNRGLCPTKK